MGIRPQRRSAWSNVEEFIKKYVIRWFEHLIGRETLPLKAFDPTSVKRILVIRQHDQLGDFLLSIPALRALRERFHDGSISLLVREYFAPLARMVPYVDDVLVFQEDSSKWTTASFYQFWRKLRSKYDLTVVLNTVSHSLTSDLLAMLSKATYTLGFGDKMFPGSSKNFFYNLIASPSTGKRHQSECNLDIVRYIGCTTDDLNITISVSPTVMARLQGEYSKFGIDTSKFIVGIHIGAGKPQNRWPVENFARIAEILHRKYQAQVLLFWGPSEEEEALMRMFCNSLSFKSCNIGHPSLDEIAGYFQCCDIVICNDTGVMHVAAGVNVPTLALFGPTSALEWKPLNDTVRSIQSSTGEMRDIDVHSVEERLQEILSQTNKKQIEPLHL